MKNILSLFIIFILVSCGTQKTKDLRQKATSNPDLVENIEPCTGKNYATNEEFLRSTINYKHINATEGKRLAREFAIEALASQIETIVSSVSDNYRKTVEMGTEQIFNARFENLSRLVINDSKIGYKLICERNFTEKSTGKYIYYLTAEYAIADILESASDKISKDEVLKVDYDYEKFKQEFEKEMERRRNQS